MLGLDAVGRLASGYADSIRPSILEVTSLACWAVS